MDIQNASEPDTTNDSAGGTRRGRRGVAAGVAAGLLGGAAAGLVLGVPGLTSAATDGEEPAGLVQQVDETDPAVPADDFEPGQRLRTALQELVDDETLTDEQADAVAAHLAEQRRERRFDREGHRGPKGPGGLGSRAGGVMSEAVTDLLGLTPTELREQLRDGATLGDIAEAQGVGTDALVDEIVGEVEERIAQGVENGRLDQADADEKLAEVEARVTDVIENGLPQRGQD